ncbi:MAG: glycosyltransferase family 4 protein [Hyphomicrobiaceae bacterium]
MRVAQVAEGEVRVRLAIFVDQVFWHKAGRLSTDESYVLFFMKFLDVVDELVFVGREAPDNGAGAFPLDHPRVSFRPLPYYESVYQLWRTLPGIYRKVRNELQAEAGTWDLALINGPHPLGHIIARQCIAAGVPIIPVLRQNLLEMMKAHGGLKRLVSMLGAWGLEKDLMRLARGRSTLAVGQEMADVYRGTSSHVQSFMPCLIDDEKFQAFSRMAPSGNPDRLIIVGRLSAEKGHKVLFKALAELKSRGRACRLDVVGTGPLEATLRDAARQSGIDTQVRFHGFVPFGPELFELYQSAGVAVFPSTTEGLPQVVNEALSIGLPVIASRVGGIPAFLTHGETALLVPPCDPSALADAIQELGDHGDLYRHIQRNGRALMARNTLEANRDIVMEVIHNELSARRA